MHATAKIAVVIPSYKVRDHILNVIGKIGKEVCKIYVIDDCCPEMSGEFVKANCKDPRVTVIRQQKNTGVGGATMAGYCAAVRDSMDIAIKIDGDGQMDPSLINKFATPILRGSADYTKGNRFYDLDGVRAMPAIRLLGNAALSFMTKISSGYWNLFDPTNGYTAIHSDVIKMLPLEKISHRYFFETDMLFNLNIIRAVVKDVPMRAVYGGEKSNLKIKKIIGDFLVKHLRNFAKRLFYNYYLRDMSLASLELPLGLAMLVFGMVIGANYWLSSVKTGQYASSGTVMLAALPVIIGLQLLLAFFAYDMSALPANPIHLPNPSPDATERNNGE